MEPEKIVRDFCNAIPRRDIDEIMSFFTPEAVYHNIPIAPAVGHDAIRAMLGQFLGPATSEAEFEVRGIASSGGTVHTERVDRFVINGKPVELPVMGAFEVDTQGKISAWRDYFDMASFTQQMG
jgi:limonene-1,2-epoxide hydrolase